MKEKIFSLAYKILSPLHLSWETERRISNFANLLYLIFKKGSRYTLRSEGYFTCSSGFVENYLSTNDSNDNIVNLKKNIDVDSQKLVDKIIKRHEYIYTHNLLDNRLIFDLEELKEQKFIQFLLNKKNGYSDLNMFPESFHYHSGLKVLPKEVLEKIKGKDAIDGGAFVGDTAIILSKKYSFGKIHSFEPDKFNFIKLRKNIAKYKIENVIPVKKGISSGEGKATMKIQGVASSISPEGKEEIEITSIDEYLSSRRFDANIGLIKLDIEGAEYDAIMGSIKTIEKFLPVLLISIYHTGKDFFEIKPWLENLNLGYNFQIRKMNPNSSVGEVMLIAYAS